MTLASLKQINLDANVLTETAIDIGLKLLVDLTRPFVGLLPNSSMVLMFGCTMLNSLPPGATRQNATVLSNRLFTFNVADSGSSVLPLRVLGNQPADRMISPFASLDTGDAVAFTGNMANPLWSFSTELSSWRVLPVLPHPYLSEPGLALLYDGSHYYFVGSHCDDYSWKTVETNEDCSVSDRVYTLDLSEGGNRWASRNRSLAPTPTLAESMSTPPSGGTLSLFADFCAYDGSTSSCGDTFIDPVWAARDSIDDTDISIASGVNGQYMAVWVTGTAVRYSLFDPSLLKWSPSQIAFDSADVKNSNPAAAYVASTQTWIIIFTSTLTLRNSGVDNDLILIQRPYPAISGGCLDGNAVDAAPGSVTFAAEPSRFSLRWSSQSVIQILAVITSKLTNQDFLSFSADPTAPSQIISTKNLGSSVALTSSFPLFCLFLALKQLENQVETASRLSRF